MEDTFKELLALCKGDLTEISGKLMQVMQQNDGGEEKLRKEIIEQGRKMNELKAESEKQLY